jgi:hypothetical protein
MQTPNNPPPHPPPGQPGHSELNRIRPFPLIGGAVLGFIASWLTFGVTLIGLYSASGDGSSLGADIVAGVGLFGLAVVLGLLLVPRRTRYWGAGFLMGLAIGAITGAGVCGGFLGIGNL